MKTTRTLFVFMPLALSASAGISCRGSSAPVASPSANACGASLNTKPQGAAWVAAADAAQPVHVTFSATIDPKNAALTSKWVQPHPEAITIQGGGSGLHMWGGVKPFANHAGRLMAELYFINDGTTGVRDGTLTISGVSGSSTFYDLTREPLSAASQPAPITVGGIAPEGISGHIRIAFDADTASDPITFDLALDGMTTSRVSTNSAPLALTPDGSEAWVTFADGDVVAILDTAKDVRVGQVEVPGQPSSVAITPDGKYVLVTTSGCNQLSVIDRAKRKVVQVFGEADGIGRDARNVVLSPDGTHAYVSAYVGATVTQLERVAGGFKVKGSVNVGAKPVGMSVTPDGGTLMVAHFMPRGPLEANQGWISVVDTATLALQPDVALDDDSNTAPSGCLRSISSFANFSASDLRTEGVPEQIPGVFLDPSGVTGWVPAVRPGVIPIFEGDISKIGFSFGTLGANSPSDLFPIDTRDPRKAAPMRLSSLIDITDRTEEFLLCRPEYEDIEAVTPFPVSGQPNEIQSPGTTVPSGVTPITEVGVSRFIGFTRGGRRALLLSFNADEIMVIDGATHHPTSQRYFLLSGSNPIGVVVTPDGNKGYVAYENSTYVSVLDLSAYAGSPLPGPSLVPFQLIPGTPGQVAGVDTFSVATRDVTNVPQQPSLEEVGKVDLVDADPLPAKTRRGRVLFESSSPVKYPTLSSHREASCSSCHPHGGNDGTVWGTMEGERRTIGLWGGTAKRGWLHASATHQDASEFATIIVQQRLGGTGLSPSDVDALSSYVAFGLPTVQHPVVDEALAAKGKALFSAKCSSCHEGDKATSGNPDPKNKYGGGVDSGPKLYDVNSATVWAGATLGVPFTNLFPPQTKQILSDLRGDRDIGSGDPVQQLLQFTQRPDRKRGEFKAPPLTNVYDNSIFFHDGRASTLEDAVVDISGRVGPPLPDDEVKALVEYLKTL